jgi:hypothetical protein
MRVDPVGLAEAEVMRDKLRVAGELEVLAAKARRTVRSPRFMAGALVGAVVLAYLATGRPGNKKREIGSARGTWSLVLQSAHLLVPLIGALRPRRQVARSTPMPLLQASAQPRQRALEANPK